MNPDLEIAHQGQLGTDAALDRKSGQKSGDGYGAAERAFVMEAVSAPSPANYLYPFRCVAVSGCNGEIR